MKYQTRPVEVDVWHWTDLHDPPPGVEDIFLGFQQIPTGYINEPPLDAYIIRLGEYLVRYPDDSIAVYVEDDFLSEFRKIE